MPVLKTDEMRERLERGGFTDQQTDALIAVIEELAEVFVTKEYFETKLKAEMRGMTIRLIGIQTGINALLLALFAYVLSIMG